MTKPNDPLDADFRGTLPADLQSLDRELSGIRIEERPSFGPELEARAPPGLAEPGAAWISSRSPLDADPSGCRPCRAHDRGGFGPDGPGGGSRFVRTVAEEASRALRTGAAGGGSTAGDGGPGTRSRCPRSPGPGWSFPPWTRPMRSRTANPDFPTIPVVVITFPELISRT